MPDGSRSSSSQDQWKIAFVRRGMLSVADLIFIALVLVLLLTPLSVRLLGDAGIGWHIRTGQQILATHTVPRVDSYSSMAGKRWFAWEWLYDVAIAYLHSFCGLNGPVWLTAIIIGATFSALFRFLMLRDANLFVALVLVLLAASASTIHFLARPHVLSWLMCLVWFWILDSTDNSSKILDRHNSSKLWILPPLMLLWVNLHGAFLLGLVLLAIFWAGALWTWCRLRSTRIEDSLQKISAASRLRQLTVLGLSSVAASFINPYGVKLHGHIYSYLSNRFLIDHIEEFQSPNFHHLAERCFLVLLMISLCLLTIHGKSLRASEVLTVLFAIYAGLSASRNIPIASILLIMSLASTVRDVPILRNFSTRMGSVESQLRGHVWPVVVILLTLMVAARRGWSGRYQVIDAHFDPKRMPVQAVDFISTERIQGPLLSPDYWGGYLIYRLYPEQKVVVDDRHDFYGSEFMKSYLQMIHIEDGWDAFLEQTQPRCLLLPRTSALANMMGKTAGWRSIYADPVAIVFARDQATLRTEAAQ